MISQFDSLTSLQIYYKSTCQVRGWDKETPQAVMLLLIEEVTELARELRKSKGATDTPEIQHEVADVALYLIHLANILGVDLASAIESKDEINKERWRKKTESQA